MWLLWVIFYVLGCGYAILITVWFWVFTGKNYMEDIEKWFKSIEPKV